MPITVSTDNPFAEGQLDEAWTYCRLASFDFGNKTGRLVYETFASHAAAYGGKPPIKITEVILGSPAEHGSPELLSPGEPAVYETVTIREPGTNGGEDDPGEFQSVLVSPAVDPIYGEPPLLRPATPSLTELIAANSEAYAALQAVVDNLLLDCLPEFSDGVIED